MVRCNDCLAWEIVHILIRALTSWPCRSQELADLRESFRQEEGTEGLSCRSAGHLVAR
jgi:hypothetical protein